MLRHQSFLSLFVLISFFAGTFPAEVFSALDPARPSPKSRPAMLVGVKPDPSNPLLFKFFIDHGSESLSENELKAETEKLVKYFLAALTIPEHEVWVNLAPHEQDRIIPDLLAATVMGKSMLEQDYELKQFASGLTDPRQPLGEKFWRDVNQGSLKADAATMSKVWIVPGFAEILEHQGIAIVGEKNLKVMMAQEYENGAPADPRAAKIFERTILPVLEKEVNHGAKFGEVRQIYSAIVLAAWYKQALKDSLFGKVYAGQGKVAGIESPDSDIKEKVYQQYLKVLREGAYNIIKEDFDPATGDAIPRKYFSGGIMGDVREAVRFRAVSSGAVTAGLARYGAAGVSSAEVSMVESGASGLQTRNASSTLLEERNFILVPAGQLFADYRNAHPALAERMADFSPEETGVIYTLFSEFVREIARLAIQKNSLSSDGIGVILDSREVLSDAWLGAVGISWGAMRNLPRVRQEELIGSMTGLGIDGRREMPYDLRVRLQNLLSEKFLQQYAQMIQRAPRNDQGQGAGQASSSAEGQQEGFLPPAVQQADELQRMAEGDRVIGIAADNAPLPLGANPVEESLLGTDLASLREQALQQIFDTYRLGRPGYKFPVYYNATRDLTHFDEAELAALVGELERLGFTRDVEQEFAQGHPGYSPVFYGLKKDNGEWANYDELAAHLWLSHGLVMPQSIVSSAVINKKAEEMAGRILRDFELTEDGELGPYRDLMARKRETIIPLSANPQARQFVGKMIGKLLQMQTTRFDAIGPQQWQEIIAEMGFVSERLKSPGDFVNQMTVLPTDGNFEKFLSQRTFHPKLTAFIVAAAIELTTFSRLFHEHKRTIFNMLDSENMTQWSAVAALKDSPDGVAISSSHYDVLLNAGLIGPEGKTSEPVRAALEMFSVPDAAARSQGDRSFKFASSSPLEWSGEGLDGYLSRMTPGDRVDIQYLQRMFQMFSEEIRLELIHHGFAEESPNIWVKKGSAAVVVRPENESEALKNLPATHGEREALLKSMDQAALKALVDEIMALPEHETFITTQQLRIYRAGRDQTGYTFNLRDMVHGYKDWEGGRVEQIQNPTIKYAKDFLRDLDAFIAEMEAQPAMVSSLGPGLGGVRAIKKKVEYSLADRTDHGGSSFYDNDRWMKIDRAIVDAVKKDLVLLAELSGVKARLDRGEIAPQAAIEQMVAVLFSPTVHVSRETIRNVGSRIADVFIAAMKREPGVKNAAFDRIAQDMASSSRIKESVFFGAFIKGVSQYIATLPLDEGSHIFELGIIYEKNTGRKFLSHLRLFVSAGFSTAGELMAAWDLKLIDSPGVGLARLQRIDDILAAVGLARWYRIEPFDSYRQRLGLRAETASPRVLDELFKQWAEDQLREVWSRRRDVSSDLIRLAKLNFESVTGRRAETITALPQEAAPIAVPASTETASRPLEERSRLIPWASERQKDNFILTSAESITEITTGNTTPHRDTVRLVELLLRSLVGDPRNIDGLSESEWESVKNRSGLHFNNGGAAIVRQLGIVLYDGQDRFARFDNPVFRSQLETVLKTIRERDGASSALTGSGDQPGVGGIDLDAARLDLRIKRDSNGVPFPLPMQDLENLNIQGFSPVILQIMPLNPQTMPLILGADYAPKPADATSEQLTLNR